MLSDSASKGEEDSRAVERRVMGPPPHAAFGLKAAVPASLTIQQYKLEELKVMFVAGGFSGKKLRRLNTSRLLKTERSYRTTDYSEKRNYCR
jgi:hypothetical protein